ncbi:hypothetical protein HNQ99_002298 [Rhizorhapis suberifaciens]|uniref:Uncharacterized protein n=1 Tax=Rhizorhapis suberifaciens TaxID=13656 RepID=A0A840HWM4_9SPHN|nr:hypothetical protein [Rhizorhapis suberifaciens]
MFMTSLSLARLPITRRGKGKRADNLIHFPFVSSEVETGNTAPFDFAREERGDTRCEAIDLAQTKGMR